MPTRRLASCRLQRLTTSAVKVGVSAKTVQLLLSADDSVSNLIDVTRWLFVAHGDEVHWPTGDIYYNFRGWTYQPLWLCCAWMSLLFAIIYVFFLPNASGRSRVGSSIGWVQQREGFSSIPSWFILFVHIRHMFHCFCLLPPAISDNSFQDFQLHFALWLRRFLSGIKFVIIFAYPYVLLLFLPYLRWANLVPWSCWFVAEYLIDLQLFYEPVWC